MEETKSRVASEGFRAFWHLTFQIRQFCDSLSVSAMNSSPLKLVLLFAIAISQIFGGISCCCLGKAVCSAFRGEDAAMRVVRSDSVESASKPQSSSRCPKCAARTSVRAVVEIRNNGNPHCNRTYASENNQCRCVKLTINSSNPTDAPSFHPDVQNAVAHDPISNTHGRIDNPPSRNYAVPIRFGGHSWQSIACVWKN